MAASKSLWGSDAEIFRDGTPVRFSSNAADTFILCESITILSKFNCPENPDRAGVTLLKLILFNRFFDLV